jgi:hypothetical protein
MEIPQKRPNEDPTKNNKRLGKDVETEERDALVHEEQRWVAHKPTGDR